MDPKEATVLGVEILAGAELEKAAAIFHREGFVCIKDPLTTEQFDLAKAGAEMVMDQQEAEVGKAQMNRGFARHSFGMQMEHWAWCQLVDLPTILPILDQIWSSEDYTCSGAGGDYSLPGAQIQSLHRDMGDFLADPWGVCTTVDLPTPFIVVNFTMVDFTVENGAIRFVPGTQRSRAAIPDLAGEPEWMRHNQLCAPANTAIIRDVRCWHGGSPNTSNHRRPMTSVGYFSPWRRASEEQGMPVEHFRRLSPRGQQLCRRLVMSGCRP